MGAIEVDHLTKKFGDLVAVDDINFAVARGEIFGLLGPNGAGKTTLIRMMTTLTPPTSGTARIGGHDIVKDPDGVRHVLGVIPQAFTSDPELDRPREHADSCQALRRALGQTRRAHQRASGIRGPSQICATRWCGTFSGGMRRRLEIARGLVHSPEILFLDEPTTGLDPVSRTNVWEMIRTLRSKSDLTILITTHYMDEADKLCDRIAIVDHGKLAALDTPERLKDSIPGTDAVEAEFVDAPAGLARSVACAGSGGIV